MLIYSSGWQQVHLMLFILLVASFRLLKCCLAVFFCLLYHLSHLYYCCINSGFSSIQRSLVFESRVCSVVETFPCKYTAQKAFRCLPAESKSHKTPNLSSNSMCTGQIESVSSDIARMREYIPVFIRLQPKKLSITWNPWPMEGQWSPEPSTTAIVVSDTFLTSSMDRICQLFQRGRVTVKSFA